LGWAPEQTLRLATAVSALAVSQVAVGFDDINVLNPLLEQVRVERLEALAQVQCHTPSMENSGDAQ
ncbi:MAG: 1-phosphofructokinase, partial [Aeromonas allosaccharophila]